MMLLIWTWVAAETVPVHAFPTPCIDPRFPVIHHGWILGCNRRGLVAESYNPQTYRTTQLPAGYEYVGLGGAVQLGADGSFSLTTKTLDKKERILEAVNAPPAGNENIWVYTTDEAVFYKEGRQAQSVQARPKGWYPPALWGERIVWVENDGVGGETLWLWDLETTRPLMPSSSPQRHPIASGLWLGWVEEEKIWLGNFQLNEKRVIDAKAVDRLALHNEKACWSQWGEDDIDIHCSDGFVLKREKHQLWPSLWGNKLVFQEDGRLMMYQFEG
ncbi:MAG: hypothetical protein VX278_11105 [Myxococcota bacterium]|nr:hypothetical protein [Myxococcota bacterium]